MIFGLRISNFYSFSEMEKLRFFALFYVLPIILTLVVSSSVMAQTNFPTGELSIKTKDNIYDFQIELALDDTHRQYGMMFRDSLPEMSGMLFVYDRRRDLVMWMKNTFIPLDILFIDRSGKIINIAKSTQPRSLSRISSERPAKAVLELNGGLTDKLQITVGDEIIHPTFENTDN